MRLEQLKYFEILSQEGSFNKAAAKAHITQPALTVNIKSMEKELDTLLVIRKPHGVSLTEEGQKVLAFSQKVSAMYQDLLAELGDAHSDCSGNISVIASTFFAEIILENFLPSFFRQYPQIAILLIENELATLPQILLETQKDFAVISRLFSDDDCHCIEGMLITDEEFFDSRFQYQLLFRDMFGICMSRNSPLANGKAIYPDVLDNSNYPATCFRLESQTSLEKLILSSNNLTLHIQAFNQQNAYCCLPYFVYKQYFGEESSVIWRPFDNNLSIAYYLIYSAEHYLTAAEQIFVDSLQKYLAQINFR